jgi:adenylosuccinate synthase
LPETADYNKMPAELKQYIEFIEESVGVPVKLLSTGPERSQTLIR